MTQSYYCNKCGYVGPVQIGHPRRDTGMECQYMATPSKPAAEAARYGTSPENNKWWFEHGKKWGLERDGFAAAALQGLLASNLAYSPEGYCREAWRLADEMLRWRAEPAAPSVKELTQEGIVLAAIEAIVKNFDEGRLSTGPAIELIKRAMK